MLRTVALLTPPFASLTYAVPEWLAGFAWCPGLRVAVPLGRGMLRIGVVFGDGSPLPEGVTARPMLWPLEKEPLLPSGHMEMVRQLALRQAVTPGQILAMVLPAGLRVTQMRLRTMEAQGKAQIRLLKDLPKLPVEVLAALGEAWMRGGAELLGPREDAAASELCVLRCDPPWAVRPTATRQIELLEFLLEHGAVSRREVLRQMGQGVAPALESLLKNGLIGLQCLEAGCAEEETGCNLLPPASEALFALSEAQEAALASFRADLDAGNPASHLLFGVTGSGKTEVYIRLIQGVLEQGKGAILLVPEIALTPQMLAIFRARYGYRVAVIHSGLSGGERMDAYRRIRAGEAPVVVGTRSAVFAPVPHLGMIVMDEEQEPTYCSENPPRYHTRDVAQFRCAQSGALLLLGSATPTVETMYYAREGHYQVFPLYRRYNEKALPEVFIADLRDELRAGNETAVSEPLRSALEENLARGEQSILFLNRRGSSRMLLCGECGEVPECPRCSVPMTYHSANGRLMCHYCGHSEPAYERCPQCGGIMKHIGTGTQKVEEELHALFPGAKVLRMDTDTVGASHGHEKLLRQFEEEKIPILLGTQMVAKGLDFENVTLVGVLCADVSLYIDNYRAPERTFSLLSQVVGRAGRGSKQGRAIIQTFTPENEVIRAAAAQDYDAFYESEIRMRRLRRYPPFADLFSFTVTGADESRVIRAAKALRDALGYAVERREELKPLSIEVLGPAGASVVKVNNRYRYRVFLVGKGCPALRRLVAEYLYAFYQHKENRGLDIFADCNAIQ